MMRPLTVTATMLLRYRQWEDGNKNAKISSPGMALPGFGLQMSFKTERPKKKKMMTTARAVKLSMEVMHPLEGSRNRRLAGNQLDCNGSDRLWFLFIIRNVLGND
jgi:hypothetical protein